MLGGLIITVISLVLTYIFLSMRRPPNFPPGYYIIYFLEFSCVNYYAKQGPQWYPIVGNSLQIRKGMKKYGSQTEVYKKWMKKYNSPVIGVKLGRDLYVMALTYPIINEVNTSEEYDGRPDNLFFRMRTMGTRLGVTSTDGEIWAEQRYFVSRNLRRLGLGRQVMEEQIQHELDELLTIFDKSEGKPIWPGQFLPMSVLNVLWTFTAGKKIARADERVSRIMSLMKQRGVALDVSGGILNAMPFLRYIAPEQSSYNLVQKFNAELKEFFQMIIDEHKADFSEDKVEEDLVYAFINEMKKAEGKPTNFTELQLTMVILDLFLGGSVTTSNTLDFILMVLGLYPDVQERCHNVVDDVLRNTAFPMLRDKSELAYIEAVILETQRFCNIIEFAGPRRVLKATTLAGYFIPKDATVMMAMETVTKDKEYWGDPDVFRPERFLDANNKVTNTDRLIVFGQGRRRCIGEALARACLFSYIAGILQKFRLELPANSTLTINHCLRGLETEPKPYEIIFKRR